MRSRSFVAALSAVTALLCAGLAGFTIPAAAAGADPLAAPVTGDIVVTGVEWEQKRSPGRFWLNTTCNVVVTFTDATPAAGEEAYEIVDTVIEPATGETRHSSIWPVADGYERLDRDGNTYVARITGGCRARTYPRSTHRFTVIETWGEGAGLERSATSRPYRLLDMRRPASAALIGDRVVDGARIGLRAGTRYPIRWNGRWDPAASFETLVTARDYDQGGQRSAVVVSRKRTAAPPSSIRVPRRVIGLDVTIEVLASAPGKRSVVVAPRDWSDLRVGYPVTWVTSFASTRGRPKVGKTTTVGTPVLTDAGERVDPVVTYRWYRTGPHQRSSTKIPGARGRSFTPRASMAGRFLMVEVSLTAPGRPVRVARVALGMVRR